MLAGAGLFPERGLAVLRERQQSATLSLSHGRSKEA